MKQSWNAERYARNARFVSEYGIVVLELLDPKAGESILDLGCGDGELTEKIQSRGARVIAVDASESQVEAAITRGVDARVMDGHHLSFDREFDAVFSNATLHWLTTPDVVLRGVYKALKSGGRFVAEMGGEGNVEIITNAIYQSLASRGLNGDNFNPWYFPSITEYQSLLEQEGFEVTNIELIPRPTPLPGDISGWLATFAEAFSNAIAEKDRAEFIDEVRQRLRPDLCDNHNQWMADYVRLRFCARKLE